MYSAVEKGSVKADNFEMEYFTFGKSERTFVILPGLDINSVISYADSVAAAYRAFAEDFIVCVFDRRKDIKEGGTVRDMAEDTASAMKALGISNADILGVSQGGMIAQWLAIEHPELVHSLILASTLSRVNENAEKVIGRWTELAEKRDISALNQSFGETLYSDGFFEKFREPILSANSGVTDADFERFIILANACEGFSTYDRLSEIKCPVFVIGAVEDRVVSGQASVEIAEKLGCELYMYADGYGHCVYDEAPDYKDRMMGFLKKIW